MPILLGRKYALLGKRYVDLEEDTFCLKKIHSAWKKICFAWKKMWSRRLMNGKNIQQQQETTWQCTEIIYLEVGNLFSL